MIRHPLWFAPGFGVAFFSAWMVIALATGEDPLPWGLAGGAAGAVTVAIWIRTGYVVSLHKARKNERHQ
ncbi:hypothetical protein ACIBHY_03130 [Nonomuraea sp. NPDC050547]|uniref:hypothetical protein n=1 Tax=unclassified Nonomuraea TaxID=2593643 RepID=UPI003790C966